MELYTPHQLVAYSNPERRPQSVNPGLRRLRQCPLRTLQPQRFPVMDLFWPPRGRFPASLPAEFEEEILGLEGWENILKDAEFERRWWGPLRRGEFPANPPVRARIEHTLKGCNIRFLFAHN